MGFSVENRVRQPCRAYMPTTNMELRCRSDVIMLFWRNNDVIVASCVRWDCARATGFDGLFSVFLCVRAKVGAMPARVLWGRLPLTLLGQLTSPGQSA